jgi:DNA-directed RNA polymerase specialized sigma24 family protein
LVGVATPDELIKNLRTTSYNIGRTIELQDFDPARDDLGPLFRTLADDPIKGNDIVRAVLRWTGGHPYLTVRLCDQLGAMGRVSPDDVDRLINEEFVSLDKLHSDVHFQQVLRFLDERIEDTIATFALYRRIRNGEQIRDEATPIHIALKLAGIIKRDRYGHLIVRNPIYARVFSDEWVAKVLVQVQPTFDGALTQVPQVIKLSPFDKLLENIHPDRNIAGEEYVRLHQMLVQFFYKRNCLFPEELADKTLDRVASKIEDGIEGDLLLYCYGVARYVALEDLRTRRKREALTEAVLVGQRWELNASDDHLIRDQMFECLDNCLEQLLPADRILLRQYHLGEKPNILESRHELAMGLGIGVNSLRIRAYRLRERLRVCINRCLNEKKN